MIKHSNINATTIPNTANLYDLQNVRLDGISMTTDGDITADNDELYYIQFASIDNLIDYVKCFNKPNYKVTVGVLGNDLVVRSINTNTNVKHISHYHGVYAKNYKTAKSINDLV